MSGEKINSCKIQRYLVHRFIWETYNGAILDAKFIDHKENNKMNNNLYNLQLLTSRENSEKYHKDFYKRSKKRVVK